MVQLADLGGLQAAGADKAWPKDALIAQDAIQLVLFGVQECPEASPDRLGCHYLLPLPADLQGTPTPTHTPSKTRHTSH